MLVYSVLLSGFFYRFKRKTKEEAMKVVRSSFTVVFAMVAIFSFASIACAAQEEAKATLTSADCVKCHAKPPADIAAKGMAHKTNVTCQDCHVGHPPTTKKIIPQCNMCHE